MSNTLDEIIGRTYTHLSVDADSETYKKETIVIPKINAVISQICRREYKNLLNNTMISGGDLRFLRKQIFIPRYDKKVIVEGADVGAVTLKLG
jgi:hypothetical protein